MAADPYQLWRFVDAQRGTIDRAIAELRDGRKKTHWMWFVFPQLAELGQSPTAKFFGIRSTSEARDFLAHPLLGPRLRQCVELLDLWAGERSAEQILGSLDAMKLRSSLTLFDWVEPGTIFDQALLHFFDGARDQRTLALLNATR